jgi:hypothetical protein
MSIAPEPILRAGNDTLELACIFCRNQSLASMVSAKMINEVMEAIHEIPRMLVSWEHHDLSEVRLHLGSFQASHWEGAPDFVLHFDKKLSEFGYEKISG